MARRKENKSLYDTFNKFMNLCLIENKSLLWSDKQYWTLNNLQKIKERIIDSPILGHELSFENKLESQMKDAKQAEWAIICDIYFIYFLPSSFITFDKKINDVSWVSEKANLVPPSATNKIWIAQKSGFTRTSMRYHSKYRQFWLIILSALKIKSQDNPLKTVSKPKLLQQIFDSVLEDIPNGVDRAHDMRHAMLYMAYPDCYERMISTRDKKRVYDKYRNLVKDNLTGDLDENIFSIRKKLSAKYDKPDRQFDFYKDLKHDWRPPAKNVNVAIDTKKGPVIVPKEEEFTTEKRISKKEATDHTKIQWHLLKLGNDMGLDIWVAKNDRNREVLGQHFTDLPRLLKELPLTFDDATNRTIELIDVLWLKKNSIVAAFEIESTTSIYSGLLRMADLISMQPNINIPLYLVAPDDRRDKVVSEVNRPVFANLSPAMCEICRYISFSALKEQVSEIVSVVKYLKPEFLDEISEICEIDGD